jgi:aspartate/methionine/tyrosine aminotransferase
MLICDETYAHINYSETGTIHLSEVIGDKVPGMALRSISKEFPWPGARCGWLEVFNRKKDPVFERYIKSLLDAKMLEVCSTTLPQMSIPLVFADSRYIPHLRERNAKFKERAARAASYFKDIPGVRMVEPKGAFYVSVVFDDGVLNNTMHLDIPNKNVKQFIEPLLKDAASDRRFILYLLASVGICVVPLTSFCSHKNGFRATLLEENPEKFDWIYSTLRESIIQYLKS